MKRPGIIPPLKFNRFIAFTGFAARVLMAACLIIHSAVPVAARVLVDGLGRKVEVPESPRRIISLAPSLTESLFALGVGDRLVGVTDYCQYPSEAKTKARVGGIINPSLETIVSLKPDLVFATSEANKYEVLARLEQFKIPVFSIVPRDIQGVMESLKLMGEAVGATARTEQLLQSMQTRLTIIQNKVKGLHPVRVLVAYELQPVITGGKRTFPTDLIGTAGGVSIAAGLEQDWPRLNIEFIIRQNPEVVFLAIMSDAEKRSAELSRWPGWKDLSAVRTGRVFSVGDRLDQPGPRILDSLELVARYLHPEAFK